MDIREKPKLDPPRVEVHGNGGAEVDILFWLGLAALCIMVLFS